MAETYGTKSGRVRRWILWAIGAAIGVIILASFMSRDDSVPVTSAKVTRSTIRSAVSTNGKVEPFRILKPCTHWNNRKAGARQGRRSRQERAVAG
jgi:hypothetical protein